MTGVGARVTNMLIRYPDREAASQAAAEIISDCLQGQIGLQATATFVASGGKSPVRCFHYLSEKKLDWSRIYVTLSDERCVPADHQQSNQKLIRDNLIKGNAQTLAFLPLEEGNFCDKTPFACSLLGMGNDGHFASLFPDSPELKEGLVSQKEVIEVSTPSSPFDRVSMTLNLIVKSNEILLLVFGEDKLKVLENPSGLPVEELLSRFPVKIIWAP